MGTWFGFSSSGVSGWESRTGEFRDMVDAKESSRSKSASGPGRWLLLRAKTSRLLLFLPPKRDGTERCVLNFVLPNRDISACLWNCWSRTRVLRSCGCLFCFFTGRSGSCTWSTNRRRRSCWDMVRNTQIMDTVSKCSDTVAGRWNEKSEVVSERERDPTPDRRT